MEDQRKNELAVIIAETVAFGFFEQVISTNSIYGLWRLFKRLFLYQLYYWWVYNSVFICVAESMCMDRGNKKVS